MTKKTVAENRDIESVLSALYACASNPENWEQVISVLGNDDTLNQKIHDQTAQQGGDYEAKLTQYLAQAEKLAFTLSDDPSARTPTQQPNIPYAFIVLDGHQKIIACNNAAKKQFTGIFKQLKIEHKLQFIEPENGARLDNAIRDFAKSGNKDNILQFYSSDHESFLFAFALSAELFPPALNIYLTQSRRLGKPHIALIFPDIGPSSLSQSSMNQNLGLTRAEANLVNKLTEGLTLKETSAYLGISVNTARNHLKTVFDKLGINRQGDLVRSLTQLNVLAKHIWPEAEGLPSVDDDPDDEQSLFGWHQYTPPYQFYYFKDGRQLAYREYGDPEGQVVLGFHEGSGSSLLPPGNHDIAKELGLRILCPERPGFGLSDPVPDYHYDVVADDMVEWLDDLGVESLKIYSILSGALFGVATALKLGDRVKMIFINSGRMIGNPSQEDNLVNRFRARLMGHPWLVDTFFSILRARISKNMMGRFIRRTVNSSPSDGAFLGRHPEAMDFIATYVIESVAVSSKGVSEEIKMFAREQPLDITDLSCRVVIWHGEDDTLSPFENLLPHFEKFSPEVILYPGIGCMMTIKYWRQISKRLA